MPSMTLGDVAERVQGTLEGDPTLTVSDVAELALARKGDLSFLASAKHYRLLQESKASAVLAPPDVPPQPMPVIRVKDTQKAFFSLVPFFRPPSLPFEKKVHEQAFIGEDCSIGPDVVIGPFTVVGRRTSIGAGSVIYSNVYIGEDAAIGENCIIYPQVSIRERTLVGDRVIIHSGAVLGSNGFGYIKEGETHVKIPQTGRVVVEDDVEIGANCTVDRAALHETRICRGTKLDNLVQVAHNCSIGSNGILAAQVGIAGSTTLGKNVILAGQVGVADHITVGDDTVFGGGAGVTKSITEPGVYWGRPAKPLKLMRKLEVYFKRLPELYERLKKLEEKVKSI